MPKKGMVIKMKKKIAFVALIILLTAVLPSCSFVTVNFDNIFPYEGTFADSDTDGGNAEGNTGSADTNGKDEIYEYIYTGAEDAKKALESVRIYDFGGISVFINTTAGDDAHILSSDFDGSEEIDENDYSAAVYERNRMVEERYQCTIRYKQTTLEAMLADIKAAVKDVEYYSDLLCVGVNELATLAAEGCLYNLRSLPHFDTDNSLFNTSAVNALSAGYYTYGTVSTATTNPDDISGVFVNLELLSGATDADLEALVKSGEWTWDTALAVANASSFSYDGTLGGLAVEILGSGGINLISSPHNDTPTVRQPAAAVKAVDVARSLSSGGKLTLGGDGFLSGDVALHVASLEYMTKLVSSEFDWTVLPMPKLLDTQTAYSSYMPEDTLAYAVPVTTTDTEGAGVLIEAISAASYGLLRDTYVKYHMYHTVRKSSTLDMLELIWDTPFIDAAHTLGKVSDKIADATYGIVYDAAESAELSAEKLFEQRKDAADSALEKYYAPTWGK